MPSGGRIVEQNERGYTVETEGEVKAGDTQGTEDGEDIPLTINRDDPQWVVYRFEVEIPAMTEDFDMAEFDRLRQEGLPPKPPLPPLSEGDESSDDFLDFSGLFDGAGEEMDLTSWYMMRVLTESGLPQMSYAVELPGELLSYELDGQTAGIYDSDTGRVTLVIDEDYMRQYGDVAHTFVVESAVHTCELTCNEFPNMIWTGEGDDTSCSCICDQGYQPDDDGDCVACSELCPAWDSRSEYDPENSQPNVCSCRCNGDLMEWDSSADQCRCVSGAEPAGDACRCPDGMEPDSWGTGCVEKRSRGGRTGRVQRRDDLP